ncbi:MAG: MBOAT family protein [Leptospiraceae bacterium]|nr:MBOAT family protein [Leptospiraceae bacterium]
MWSVWQYGLLIALSTLVDYTAGLLLARTSANDRLDNQQKTARRRRWILLISLAMNLGILAYFKYTDFFIDSFIDFLIETGMATFTAYERQSSLLRLILPIGISFFTFQSMSYTIDVYRDVIPAEKSLLRFALFISFFPQLVAGPIVTAREFLPQLDRLPVFDLETMRRGLRYFALGYFKKVVLADNMAPIVDQIYSHPQVWDTGAHWVGALAFWVQVYGDFSGYSDMAIGTALLLGFNLPENFRLPYLSTSVTEHWQRWHMSLIRWNRDYVYIPLGGSQVSYWRHKWNVWLTMFLAGVWHGANWTFAIWGAIHGTFLVVEALFASWRKARARRTDQHASVARVPGRYFRPGVKGVLRTLLAFGVTSFITVFFGTMFRSNSIQDSLLIMLRLLGLDNPGLLQVVSSSLPAHSLLQSVSNSTLQQLGWSVAAILGGHILGWWIFEKGKLHWQPPAWAEFCLLALWIGFCMQLGFSGVAPFIYFQF